MIRSILLFALLSAPAHAALSPEQLGFVQKTIKQATERFAAKDYAKALSLIREVEPLASALGLQYKAAIQRNIARCLEQLGQPADAITAYEAFLVLAATGENKGRFDGPAADAKAAIERLKESSALHVSCEGVEATVSIQGLEPANLPCPATWLFVKPGDYVAAVDAPSGIGVQREISTSAARRSALVVSLPGHVELKGAPAGASLLVDGRPHEPFPTKPLVLGPGRHVVQVRVEGRAPWEQVVKLQAGEAQSFEVVAEVLPPPPEPERVVWPWVLGGASLVTIGTGAAFLVFAQDRYQEAADKNQAHNEAEEPALRARLRDEANNALEEGDLNATLGYSMVGLGSAMLVGAAAWLWLELDDHSALLPSPGGATLQVRF